MVAKVWIEIYHMANKIHILDSLPEGNYYFFIKEQYVWFVPRAHDIYLVLVKPIEEMKKGRTWGRPK